MKNVTIICIIHHDVPSSKLAKTQKLSLNKLTLPKSRKKSMSARIAQPLSRNSKSYNTNLHWFQ